MPEAAYEYYGLTAQTWDLFRGDTSGWEDRRFYLDIIHDSGQPVLDVGCGTGRLLVDYLGLGIDIEGVDISPEMLELCHQKAQTKGLTATLYEGSMETMALPRKYQTILVPSSSFQLIIEPDQAQRAIKNLYYHLLPGGMLVMPFMLIQKEDDSLEHDWQLSGEVTRPADGATIRRWNKNRFDPVTQLEHTEHRYEVIKDGKLIASEYHKRSPATRQYSQKQALDLYIQAGFDDLQVRKGFTHQQASDMDEIFTISGVRP